VAVHRGYMARPGDRGKARLVGNGRRYHPFRPRSACAIMPAAFEAGHDCRIMAQNKQADFTEPVGARLSHRRRPALIRPLTSGAA